MPAPGATIEHVFYQGSLLGFAPAGVDTSFAGAERRRLDADTWVEWVPHWLSGADDLFDELLATLPLRQRTGIRMYDRLVDEPRLTAWWSEASGGPDVPPLLHDIRHLLAERYDEPFDSIGFNLYRDRHDSVAWHADRHRHVVADPVIAILSVGRPRPLRLRPNEGGRSIGYPLGEGDLFVMGGACQHRWQHCVPKLGHEPGPRLSITFRCLARAPL